jgi:hypothetical protein
MAGITAAQAETQLSLWLDAMTAVAAGQSYSIKGRSLSRADAGSIKEMVDYWDSKCRELAESTAGGVIQSQFTIIDT